MKEIEIYIDGASKGNPGPSGIGVVICRGGQILRNLSQFIGEATNNIAEYTALIYGLEVSLILGAESVKVNTDSQLLFRQIKKIYRIKNSNILGLYNQVIHMISAFKNFSIIHIPRENNKRADKLANKAVKEASKR